IGSAQGREPRGGRTPGPEHFGEHLVGLTASRCGLTRFWQRRAMEFTWGSPSVMRPVTGTADPTRAGAMAVPGAAAAPEYSLQAVAPRPRAAPRHTTPLRGLPSGADLMRRTPLRAGGEVLLPVG